MTEVNFETLIQKAGDYDSRADAKIALDSVVNSLIETLGKCEDVTLEGVGTFTAIATDVAMKGPTIVPGSPKREFYKNPFSTKTLKIRFDNVLKHKINNNI